MLPIKIKNKKINVELAKTHLDHLKGLSFRDHLPQDQGMLFCYEKPQKMSYWMKDTYIPLSIAFISSDGKISQIEDMEPGEGNGAQSATPCQYALEANKGWFAKNDIRAGDSVDLPLFNMMEIRKKKDMSNTSFLNNYIEQNLMQERKLSLVSKLMKSAPEAAVRAEKTAVGVGRGLENQNQAKVAAMAAPLVVKMWKQIASFLEHTLKNEVFYNVAFRKAASDNAKKSVVARILNSPAKKQSIGAIVSKLYNAAAKVLERIGTRAFLTVFREAGARFFAKHLMKFVPWAWIGWTIWDSIIKPFTSSGKYGGVDIFDSRGDFFLAWTNPAKATSNPARSPGQRMQTMARKDYDGIYYASEWEIWPEDIQIAFCQQNNRQPKLKDGNFPSQGPTCEDLEIRNPEMLKTASYPGDAPPILKSTEEGESFAINYSDSEEIESKSMAESLFEKDTFIHRDKLKAKIREITQQITQDRVHQKKIQRKLWEIVTHGGKVPNGMGMRESIMANAAKGILSRLNHGKLL